MTDLQKRVAEEFAACGNISLAAKRAGIQGENARISAWQMLQIEEVSEYVQQLQDAAAERCQITLDAWLYEWKKLGFSNIKNYVNDDLTTKNLSEVVDPEAIRSIKRTITEGDFGTKTVVEVSLHDKPNALTNIGKHLGWYEKDNEQGAIKIKVTSKK